MYCISKITYWLGCQSVHLVFFLLCGVGLQQTLDALFWSLMVGFCWMFPCGVWEPAAPPLSSASRALDLAAWWNSDLIMERARLFYSSLFEMWGLQVSLDSAFSFLRKLRLWGFPEARHCDTGWPEPAARLDLHLLQASPRWAQWSRETAPSGALTVPDLRPFGNTQCQKQENNLDFFVQI